MILLASLRRRDGAWLALVAVISASACQIDGHADFDDSKRPVAESGGAGEDPAPYAIAGSGGSASGGVAGGVGGSASGGTNAAGTSQGGASLAGGGSGGATAGKGGFSGGPDEPSHMAGAAGASYSTPVTLQVMGVEDAYITSCKPETNYGDDERLIVDRERVGGDLCTHDALLRASLGAIPRGSRVEAATLELRCLSEGAEISVSYVDAAWKDRTVVWSNRPATRGSLGHVTCGTPESVTLDLTAAVGAWLSGARENLGIYLSATANDGSDFASSEATQRARRPTFSVTYSAPE